MTTRPNFEDQPAWSAAYRDDRTIRFAHSSASPSRFRTQSHALGTPIASPRALLVAAAIAVALYILGSRLSD